MADVVHLSGQWIYSDSFLRQRCAWCGFLLVDDDFQNLQVAEGQKAREPVGFDPNCWIFTSSQDGFIGFMENRGPSDGHYPDDSCMKEEIRRRRHPPLASVPVICMTVGCEVDLAGAPGAASGFCPLCRNGALPEPPPPLAPRMKQ